MVPVQFSDREDAGAESPVRAALLRRTEASPVSYGRTCGTVRGVEGGERR